MPTRHACRAACHVPCRVPCRQSDGTYFVVCGLTIDSISHDPVKYWNSTCVKQQYEQLQIVALRIFSVQGNAVANERLFSIMILIITFELRRFGCYCFTNIKLTAFWKFKRKNMFGHVAQAFHSPRKPLLRRRSQEEKKLQNMWISRKCDLLLKISEETNAYETINFCQSARGTSNGVPCRVPRARAGSKTGTWEP